MYGTKYVPITLVCIKLVNPLQVCAKKSGGTK
jgi:hypothetical protein